MLDELKRRKWNWLGHALRRNDDCIDKQHKDTETEGDKEHIIIIIIIIIKIFKMA